MDISKWNLQKIQVKELQKNLLKKEFLEQIVWIVWIEPMLFNQLLVDIFYFLG
jgi:hypothetical protein